jgi:ABC-2 type transport system permease protein
MTLAPDRWSLSDDHDLAADGRPGRGGGVLIVWRLEVTKLTRQVRVWVAIGLCVTAPFLGAAAVKVQGAVPQDTLFGQWLHQSGFALPLVVLGFAGQWVLPLLTSVVSGDIFSAEDHFGTWKTILTRSRSRSDFFAGKLLAALTYTVVVFTALTGASLAAGLLLSTKPLVGLSGQLVPAGSAAPLVVASWATQLAPMLGFAALAMLLSIATRYSPIGMGGPVLIGLVMQLLTLINLPESLRAALLSTPFASWHGFWVATPFYGPLRQGLVTSAVWFVVCIGASWAIFRRRSIAAR